MEDSHPSGRCVVFRVEWKLARRVSDRSVTDYLLNPESLSIAPFFKIGDEDLIFPSRDELECREIVGIVDSVPLVVCGYPGIF